MIDGQTDMLSPKGITEKGHSGPGAVKVTLLYLNSFYLHAPCHKKYLDFSYYSISFLYVIIK